MNINIPGLRNSGEQHWQTIWEKTSPDTFYRINQLDWERPDCGQWTARVEEELEKLDLREVILVGHSVGCATITHWHQKYGHKIKGALLVAPSDVDKPGYPKYITGFSPMPLSKLPFPSIVVASSNDHVVAVDRAKFFADCWGSSFVQLENAGHIEDKSGFGDWDQGLELIHELRQEETKQ